MPEEKKPEEKKYQIEIRSEFKKDKDFKKYYVTGAIGGFRNRYDFRLTFYDLGTNDLILQSDPIKFDRDLSEDEKLEKINQLKLKNTLLFEVIMTEEAVKELYAFLGKELKKLETMKEAGGVKFHI